MEQRVGNITVILNGYKRPHTLKEQYQAIMAQSIKPAEVMFWRNDGDVTAGANSFPKDVVDACVSFQGNKNLGVWARFSFALMAKTKYVCVFDDDTIPGNRWIENCILTNKKHRGLLCTVGVIFHTDRGYDGPYHRVGWPEPNEQTQPVDLPGHSFFFERELLTAFWRELPDPKFVRCGEDIHFSYAIQKYMGLNTYVPPHPKNDMSLWGSLPTKAMTYGTDLVAVSNPQTNGGLSMNEMVMICRSKGYKFVRDRELLIPQAIDSI